MNQTSNLMRWAVNGQHFVNAIQAVKRNRGAPGVDGARAEDLPAYLLQNWERVKAELLTGNYTPQPVLGMSIPKPSGGTRKLGIPTVIDRLIQQSIHGVLSKIWEPDFCAYSFGFRPKRSAHDALRAATEYINSGRQWIIDLDLKSFFDRVNHDKLMSLISRKVEDKILLGLIRRYLQSGLQEGAKVIPRRVGTPQGGPLSPLLSNILLNELDQELERRGHKFVRYADDCSIFLKSRRAAERVLGSIKKFLENKLFLEVNLEKTSICRPVHFEMLGHSFVPTYKKGERGRYQLRIAKKSWQRLKAKIKVITRKTTPMSVAERLPARRKAGRHRKTQSADAWLGALLQVCDRLSKAERARCVDKMQTPVLHLESVEATETTSSGVPTTGRGRKLGTPIRLLPKGRLVYCVQPDYGHHSHRRSPETKRIHSLSGILPQSQIWHLEK